MTFNGTVKRWLDDRHFGFISRDDGQSDVFVHINAISDGNPLKPGQLVEFEITEDDRGRPRAGRVRRLDGPIQFGDAR